MSPHTAPLLHIPTNLITGFLGAGKTSAILHLLAQKPAQQKWAVLVNEFGSVGIDGAIYRAHGVEVKEIPGGCMCCAAGVPLQVAVNQLLKASRPDRLLIEASGLGHPKRVMETLRGTHFQEVLAIQASICLIDPQKLLDPRARQHETFNDQIAISDVLVANKTDLATPVALAQFDILAAQSQPAKAMIAKTRFGKLDLAWLELPANHKRYVAYSPLHSGTGTAAQRSPLAYQSHGWVFPDTVIFKYDELIHFFNKLQAQRLKAILHTDHGWFRINAQSSQIDVAAIEPAEDNRIEIIDYAIAVAQIEQNMNNCMAGD